MQLSNNNKIQRLSKSKRKKDPTLPSHQTTTKLRSFNDELKKASIVIFSENLNTLLTKQQVDFDTLAMDLQIDKWRVKRWVTGKCYPQHKMMIAICNYFGYYDIYTLLTKRLEVE